MKALLRTAVIAAIVFIIGIPSITAASSAETVDSGKCGEKVTWQLDTNGTLTIAGKGKMKNYAAYNNGEAPWKDYWLSCKRIVIKRGVTSIGSYAFNSFYYYGGALKLPDGLKSIGKGAFSSADFKGNLRIPDSVKSIGAEAFKGAGFNGTLTIGKNVTGVGDSAFSSCKFKKLVFTGKKLKKIGDCAFLSCKFKGKLKIPESVKNIGDQAFSGCGKISGTFKLPGKIKTIGASAFLGCKGISGTLTLPKSVTKAGAHAFKDCNGIKKVVFKCSTAKVDGKAFVGVSAIAPGKPELVSVTGEEGVFKANWKKMSGKTDGYFIKVYSVDDYHYSRTFEADGSKSRITISNLESGLYEINIEAYHKIGKQKFVGEWSGERAEVR